MTVSKFNVLTAFRNIIDHPHATINPTKISSNRINSVGDALEGFIKDAVVGLLGENSVSDAERDGLYSQAFSWLGNGSNPPDCIIRAGDAIEIKKIQSLHSDIALNSSHPKNKIYADDTRIVSAAKSAENWLEKDIIYAIGSTSDNSELQRLWFIYGDCYAASREVYERLITSIGRGITSIQDVVFQQTNELGKVNKVDPLGITNMRIRGMWHISNPSKLYYQLVNKTENRQFYLLMRESKYKSFPENDRLTIESVKKDGFVNQVVDIRNPDNPANLISARFIKYEI